jgi:hypothetical protein
MDGTGAARVAGAGGNDPADPTSSQQLQDDQLAAIGRVRTRADLAALINAGSDSITIKTEICGNTDEPMEDDDEDAEAVCIVNLDESNRVIYMDDPFGTDDNYVYDGSDSGRDGEELLEESGGGDQRHLIY